MFHRNSLFLNVLPGCRNLFLISLSLLIFSHSAGAQSPPRRGGVRGTVSDGDFEVPLPGVKVVVSESGRETVCGDSGNFFFSDLDAGVYTLVFSKAGYMRAVRPEVVVSEGRLTEIDVEMAGEYEEMDELVVREISLGGSSELGLLNLRMESSGIMDAVGQDLMKRAGASDAAGALKLVAGATVQDGKYAVIRGLGDRYTSTSINHVRLPSADPDKRAVHLDQFPAALIESIQVSKNFMADMQGDASGGGINMVTKALPDGEVLSFSIGVEYDSEVTGNKNFISNDRNVMNYWGMPKKDQSLPYRASSIGNVSQIAPNYNRWAPFIDLSDDEWEAATGLPVSFRPSLEPSDEDIARLDENNRLLRSLSPVLGTTAETPPLNHGWSAALGNAYAFESGFRVGGMATFSYKNKYSGYFNGEANKYNVEQVGIPLRWREHERIDKGEHEIIWGSAAVAGIEFEDTQELSIAYLRSQVGQDESWNIIQDVSTPEGGLNGLEEKPNITQLLSYTERTVQSLQLHGGHELFFMPEVDLWSGGLSIYTPVFDWTVAKSRSTQFQPDYTEFITQLDRSTGIYSVGNPTLLSRKWFDITEDSDQYFMNLEFPFECWGNKKGFLKTGFFHDDVSRKYLNDNLTYNNSRASVGELNSWGPKPSWELFHTPDYTGRLSHTNLFGWSVEMSSKQGVPVDYTGAQKLQAAYLMADLPAAPWLNAAAGARLEKTSIQTSLYSHSARGEVWVPGSPVAIPAEDAGADLRQTDLLPALGLVWEPVKNVFLRGAYSRTVARPTFKEITPVLTFDGSDVFQGNPNLVISDIENYDLRLEWLPRAGDLLAASAFYKDISNPIDSACYYTGGYNYVYPDNFRRGQILGLEFEVRKRLGFLPGLPDGLSVGANYTMLDSQLTYDPRMPNYNEIIRYSNGNGTRPMEGQAEFLLNANVMYDDELTGFSMGLFYNLAGESILAGESYTFSDNDEFIYTPNIYQTSFGLLNFSASKRFKNHWKLNFNAKNLLQPDLISVYRLNGEDQIHKKRKTSSTYSVSVGYDW